MRSILIKQIEIGAGLPKLAVSICEKNHEGVLETIRFLSSQNIDLIEIRADHFTSDIDIKALLSEAEAYTQNKILLFTLRTKPEGGKMPFDMDLYKEMMTQAIQSGCIDMIDIEHRIGIETLSHLITLSKQYGVYTVISLHDMSQTPTRDHLLKSLELMKDAGGDVVKLAMMPQNKEDVINLMQATLTFKKEHQMPIISMSMGELGKITRVLGAFYGSDLTFAAYGAPSASGQLGINETIEGLKVINHCLFG